MIVKSSNYSGKNMLFIFFFWAAIWIRKNEVRYVYHYLYLYSLYIYETYRVKKNLGSPKAESVLID